MRKFLLIMIGLMLVPVTAMAIWQVADPSHGTKYHKRGLRVDYPRVYTNGAKISCVLRKGSLRSNVMSCAEKYNWRVAWSVTNNYSVTINTKIVGPTFPIVMSGLLSHYPVHATYSKKYQKIIVSGRKYAPHD